MSNVTSDAAKTRWPHGKNITEGGFDSNDSKNVSFNSDISGENDSGQAVENQFQRQMLRVGMIQRRGCCGRRALVMTGSLMF